MAVIVIFFINNIRISDTYSAFRKHLSQNSRTFGISFRAVSHSRALSIYLNPFALKVFDKQGYSVLCLALFQCMRRYKVNFLFTTAAQIILKVSHIEQSVNR